MRTVVQHTRENAHPDEAHDLAAGVEIGQPIAYYGIRGASAVDCQLQQPVQLRAKQDRVRRRLLASLQSEERVRDRPTLIHLADDLRSGRDRVGEEHLVEFALPRERPDRADFDPGLVQVHEEKRDTGVLGGCRIGTCEEKDAVRLTRPRRPQLLAVDHPTVTVQLGPRRQRSEVGTGTRLRETLAPSVLTAQDPRQVEALLLLGAPAEQRATEHLDAERVVVTHCRHTGARQLLDEHHLFDLGESGSPVLLRPRHGQESVGGECVAP